MQAQQYGMDGSFFEIVLRQHSDVLHRMSLRHEKEKILVIGMAMDAIRGVLDKTDKCHPHSPIERLAWMYLARWISQQEDSHRYKILVQYHLPDTGNGARYIDLVVQYVGDVSTLTVAIECDGKEHLKPHVAAKDEMKDKKLWEQYGVETVRLTSIRIFNDEEYCVQKVMEAFRRAEELHREGYIH